MSNFIVNIHVLVLGNKSRAFVAIALPSVKRTIVPRSLFMFAVVYDQHSPGGCLGEHRGVHANDARISCSGLVQGEEVNKWHGDHDSCGVGCQEQLPNGSKSFRWVASA